MQSNYKVSPLAQTFKSELKYMLEMYFAMNDYYDIYFAHMYFHAYKAYNIQELEATHYFNGLESSLIGTFRVVIPMNKVEFDF